MAPNNLPPPSSIAGDGVGSGAPPPPSSPATRAATTCSGSRATRASNLLYPMASAWSLAPSAPQGIPELSTTTPTATARRTPTTSPST
ncbi:unnamed protein product [Urochloa humidicola]